MDTSDDELCDDRFCSRPTKTHKLAYTGRLSLKCKLYKKQEANKPTVDLKDKPTYNPSNKDPKNSTQSLLGSYGKNTETTLRTAGCEASDDSDTFQQNQTANRKKKTPAIIDDAEVDDLDDCFCSTSTKTGKSTYTGRLSLKRKLYEKQESTKPTVDLKVKPTYNPSKKDPKNCTKNLQGSYGKNAETTLTIACCEASDDSDVFEQSQTANRKKKTRAIFDDAELDDLDDFFCPPPTRTGKSTYTGRLSLNRKLYEKREGSKLTVDLKVKPTYNPSNKDPKNLATASYKTFKDPVSFEQSQTSNRKQKTRGMIEDAELDDIDDRFCSASTKTSKSTYTGRLSLKRKLYEKQGATKPTADLKDKPTYNPSNKDPKNCTQILQGSYGKNAETTLTTAGCEASDNSDTFEQSQTANRKKKTPAIIDDAEVDDPDDFFCSPPKKPGKSSYTGQLSLKHKFYEKQEPKVSSSQNVSHLISESSDNVETLQIQKNISEAILLPHLDVNILAQSEVGRLLDCTSLDNQSIFNKLPGENSLTLPNWGEDKLQMQQHTTRLLTGDANATMETSAGEKKSANKKAWEGMMSLMRSGAKANQAKNPIKRVSAPAKVEVQTQQSKPSGGNHSNTTTIATTSKRSRWNSNGDRPCPFYKKIPGTGFVVDAFNYGSIPGVSSYFLSHFHSDHYIGLKASFSWPIYCTSVTASLVQANIRVKSQFLHILPLNKAQEIEGVQVTALDANHCPGSAMLLFQMRSGVNILHVGDFRATPAMEGLPALCGLRISQLYLDTTYCDAKYSFPTQEDAVASAVKLVLSHLDKHPRSVVVCGTYLIGKEKLFMGVAEVLGCRIWAEPSKAKTLRLLQDPAIATRLVNDPAAATVHVVSMQQLNFEALQRYQARNSKQFSHILALRPSGWEHSKRGVPSTRGNITIAGVAYSEHSSFTELARFVRFIRPTSIIPTVNVGSAQSRQAMKNHFVTWLPSLQ